MAREIVLWEIDGKDQPYIAMRHSGIHQLIVFTDGLPVLLTRTTKRGKEKMLIGLRDALEWHRREQKYRSGKRHEQGQQAIAIMDEQLEGWKRRHVTLG